uniref:Unspecific monooxygenase n=1 Tax=Phocoena sinus TaxID=42100 RepID=A0A8C9EC08_PHOSS
MNSASIASIPFLPARLLSTLKVTNSLIIWGMVFVFVRALRSKGRKRVSPPGPWSFPIIGNLLQLGDHPYLTFMETRKKYGNVFLIRLGMVPVLVVNGMEMVKQVLLKVGEGFPGRPNMHTFSFLAEGKSLNVSENCFQCFTTFSKAEAKSSTCFCLLEKHVIEEVSELVKVSAELTSKNGSFDPRGAITCAVANVVCALCLGKRCDHSDEEFLRTVKENGDLLKASKAANPADFILCFGYLPLQIINSPQEFYQALNQFIALHVQDHLTTYDKDYIQDITDALINTCHNKYAATKTATLNDDEIISTVNDLFGAEFETISTCLYWSFLYLIYYPEIQAKIQGEIGNMLSDEKKILPSTEAFIKEIFRHASFLPFTILHCTTSDTTLNGYFIPRKTCTFINITIWDNPNLFRPERFLNENMELNRTLEDVARNEIFIFITTVLQQLKLEKCPEAELDLTPMYGLSMKPTPYQLQVETHSTGVTVSL